MPLAQPTSVWKHFWPPSPTSCPAGKAKPLIFLPSFQSGMLASPCCLLFPQFAPSKWGNGAPVVNVRCVLMAITPKETVWTRATIPPWWLGGPLWAAIGGPGLQKNCSPFPCPSLPGCRPGSTCWSMQRNGNGNSEFQNFPPLFGFTAQIKRFVWSYLLLSRLKIQ